MGKASSQQAVFLQHVTRSIPEVPKMSAATIVVNRDVPLVHTVRNRHYNSKYYNPYCGLLV